MLERECLSKGISLRAQSIRFWAQSARLCLSIGWLQYRVGPPKQRTMCEQQPIQVKSFSSSPFTKKISSRERERLFRTKITGSDLEDITKLTGCLKPCQYRMYQFVGAEEPVVSPRSEYFAFSLWAVSKKTTIKTEQLVYPLSSLVAEFGGTLGLFLGFSFVTVWDSAPLLGTAYNVIRKRHKDS